MFVSLFALASVAVFFQPKSAHAYPGFARKYNFPCSFCHIQWPRLADTGHFFKDRGFMMSTTGKANGLDMMFEKPGNQNYFPIGFHMSMAYYGSAVNGVENTGGNKNNGGWANGPASNTIWDIESGGLINNWISFWVQPGGGGSPGPNFGIVKLWVRFDDLFNTTWANLYVGKSSIDTPVSNQRAMAIGTGTPFTMYDFQPGTPEVANNGGTSVFSFPSGGLGLYFDGDSMEMFNDQTQFRYFGYHIGSPMACMTQKAFSLDPCETRVSISFIPNQSLYGNTGFNGQNPAYTYPTYSAGPGNTTSQGAGSPSGLNNNGFSYFAHITQSFGGWGRTNGERIGVFAMLGEGSAVPGSGAGANSPGAALYSREGVDVMFNPIPNGGLNIDGAWEIVNDPTGLITANGALLPNAGPATSGLEYMTWWISANWQPTFNGFFSQSGTNSNLFEVIYNQLDMMQQPTFANAAALPGNYDNVLAFTLLDRYWLWGSDRADISLFAQYQYMINYGVSGALNNIASASGQFHAQNIAGSGYFGNVEANNFSVGLDFAY
jgi:hypothetical protein